MKQIEKAWISIVFLCTLVQVISFAQKPMAVLFSATPESYPGAKDGKIVATISDMKLYPAPYTFRIRDRNFNGQEYVNNTGTYRLDF